jgi:hypothetical protein
MGGSGDRSSGVGKTGGRAQDRREGAGCGVQPLRRRGMTHDRCGNGRGAFVFLFFFEKLFAVR